MMENTTSLSMFWQIYFFAVVVFNLMFVISGLLLIGLTVLTPSRIKEGVKELTWKDILVILLFLPGVLILILIYLGFYLLELFLIFFEENKIGRAINESLSKTPFKRGKE